MILIATALAVGCHASSSEEAEDDGASRGVCIPDAAAADAQCPNSLAAARVTPFPSNNTVLEVSGRRCDASPSC